MEEQFSRFLDVFKKIEINLPFAEALTHMPNYAKFLKDILSEKRKFAKKGLVNLTATCSAVIQRSLPMKMQDPSSFTIPYTIGTFKFKRALCDSGASINLMPLSMVKRLSFGELTPTSITLQIADKTMAQLEGVLEDELIKVGKFIFPVDFVVMDMEEDTQVPLLLGRPFLATKAALIDVKKRELTLMVGEVVVHFNLNKSLKQSECESTNCKTVVTIVSSSPELNFGCNYQNSINENEMNFQYLDDLDFGFLNSSFDLKETVLSLNENNTEKSSSNEERSKET